MGKSSGISEEEAGFPSWIYAQWAPTTSGMICSRSSGGMFAGGGGSVVLFLQAENISAAAPSVAIRVRFFMVDDRLRLKKIHSRSNSYISR